MAGVLILVLRNHHRPNAQYEFELPPNIKLAIDAFTDHYPNSTFKVELPSFAQDLQHIAEEGGDEDEEEEEELATCLTPEPHEDAPELTAQSHPRQTAIQDHLHRLLFALYSQLPGSVQGDSFYSPIVRWIVLASLKKTGTWAKTGDISQLIATALFCGRLVMYNEVNMGLEPDGHHHNFHL